MRIVETETRKRRETHTKSYSYGNNWWIYCTSIKPAGEEWEAWQSTLPEEYDHISEIGQPAKFAQALARMVTDQLGAQSGDGQMQDTTPGSESWRTNHRQQLVIHGPVVYTDSVYDALDRIDDEKARVAAFIFTKVRKYADQREYRFAIFNGGSGEETVSLQISGMMRDALRQTGQGLFRTASARIAATQDDRSTPLPAGNDGNTLVETSRTVSKRLTERKESRSETKTPAGRVESSENECRECVEERIVKQVHEPGGAGFLTGSCGDREDSATEQDRPAQELLQSLESNEGQPSDEEVVRELARGEREGHEEHRGDEDGPRTIDGLFEWLHRSAEKMLEDPATPMSPSATTWQEAACSPEGIAATFGSIENLALKIDKVKVECRQDAASACWYATQCIRNIHARLGDIVDSLWIERERFVVIRLKESKKLQAKGQIAIAPSGSYAYCLQLPDSERSGFGGVEWGTKFFPIGDVVETFEAFGWPAKTS